MLSGSPDSGDTSGKSDTSVEVSDDDLKW